MQRVSFLDENTVGRDICPKYVYVVKGCCVVYQVKLVREPLFAHPQLPCQIRNSVRLGGGWRAKKERRREAWNEILLQTKFESL